MRHVLGLECIRCKQQLPQPGLKDPLAYACPDCGGNLKVRVDTQAIGREVTRASLAANPDRTLWRYQAFLPVTRTDWAARLDVGGTPLSPAPELGSRLGLPRLLVKDDTRHRSASFKDRAGAVALAVAHERGEKVVAGASTGNAASSTACLAARTGQRAIIFVPHTAPQAKVAQILLFGATVIAVQGTYDEAFDLCQAACREYGWYNRNTGTNPYTREGKKTAAFEILEQLGWQVPDYVAVSVGDGNILSGLWKGFVEARAVGLVDSTPRLLAVQAEHSNAVKLAYEGDGQLRPVSGETIADSISVSVPRDGDAAVQALQESHGSAVSVSDDDILDAMRDAASLEGLFLEPAAAATVAGLKAAAISGLVPASASVVAVVTGSGLKDVASALKASGAPHLIKPDLEALKALVRERMNP